MAPVDDIVTLVDPCTPPPPDSRRNVLAMPIRYEDASAPAPTIRLPNDSVGVLAIGATAPGWFKPADFGELIAIVNPLLGAIAAWVAAVKSLEPADAYMGRQSFSRGDATNWEW